MDNNWKNRFENAEVAPPDALWANIESGLAAPGSARPWILTTVGIAATASLLFAASITGYFVFNSSSEIDSSAISNVDRSNGTTEQVVEPIPDPKKLVAETKDQTDEQQDLSKASIQPIQTPSPTNVIESESVQNETPVVEQFASVKKEPESQSELSVSNPVNEETSSIELIPESEVVKTQIARVVDTISLSNTVAEIIKQMDEEQTEELPIDDLIDSKKSKKGTNKNRLWAGVYQGIGGFASNISSGSASSFEAALDGESFSLTGAIASEQSTVRSINEKQVVNTTLLVGVPLADKLSIVSGFQYSKSSFASTAGSIDNQLLHFTATPQEFDSFSDTNFQRTDLDGFYEMATIPLMADYQILSQRFRWSVQAGPSIGLLIRQKIMSDELGLSQTTQPGDLYEPIHFRIGIGSSVSYQIGDNYQVSLRPFIDQAVTSITTSSASFSSYPLNYSISIGLLYQF